MSRSASRMVMTSEEFCTSDRNRSSLARKAASAAERSAERPEEPLLLLVVELLDVEVQPAQGGAHPGHLGAVGRPRGGRLCPGDGVVDRPEVVVDRLQRRGDQGIVVAEALEQEQLVAE